jgi:hypothetical protein
MLALTMSARPTPVADQIAARIALYLGPQTAKVAVASLAQREVGRRPENLELEHVPALLAALRPMLRTFVGASQCEILLRRLARELGC